MWFRDVVCVATLFAWLHLPTEAQAQSIQEWSAVDAPSGAVVLIVDANVALFFNYSNDKKFVDEGRWSGGPFVRQYRVSPGFFQLVGLPESGNRWSVNVTPGSLTYVRFSPYRSNDGGTGVRVTNWSGGAVPDDIAGSLADAFSKGIQDAYKTPLIPPDIIPRVLNVSTAPPWPIPPLPKK